MQAPRLCAHRGFNTIAPENTLPAFATAVSLGTDEIELDLWPTADGEIVVCHDPTVDRTTDGSGAIVGLTCREIARLDAGSFFSPRFRGVRIPRFEEVLEQFAGRVTFNIHIKSLRESGTPSSAMLERFRALSAAYTNNAPVLLEDNFPGECRNELTEFTGRPYDCRVFDKIITLIERYHCASSVYITGEADVLSTATQMAPQLERCCLEGHMTYSIVANALRYKCSRVQFCKLFVTQEMIDLAHHHGIHCNLFWSDHPDEAQHYAEHGIDTILTNDFMPIKHSFYYSENLQAACNLSNIAQSVFFKSQIRP